MSKANKVDARIPDPFMQTMGKGFDWLTKNIMLVLGAVVVVFAAGGAYAVWTHISESRESDWQEKYFSIEKQVVDKKQGYEEANKPVPPAVKGKAPAPVSTAAKATGDLEKDYGTLPKQLNDLIQAAPETRAAEMAALNLADLQAAYKKPTEALATLSKVNTRNGTSDLLGALVVNMKAGLQADQGDCKSAVSLWEKIVQDKQAKFLQDEAKLRMGLCLETMNDLARAEQLYGEVAKKDAKEVDPSAAKEANRYLRLLKIKKGAAAAKGNS